MMGGARCESTCFGTSMRWRVGGPALLAWRSWDLMQKARSSLRRSLVESFRGRRLASDRYVISAQDMGHFILI